MEPNTYRHSGPEDPDKIIYGTPYGPNKLDGTPKDDEYTSMTSALGLGILNQIQTKFVESSAFASAYKLFSSGPSPDSWLPRLTALVSSLEKSQGELTNFVEGLVGDVQGTKLLQEAYTNLSNLVAEYNQWFNSLPPIQRQQFAEAGINIALDGGSQITGSSMPSGSAQFSDSQNAANQAFDNAFNFVSSLSGGLLDLIGLVSNTFISGKTLQIAKDRLKQDEDISIQNLNLQRGQLGLQPISSLSHRDSSTDIQFFDFYGKNAKANEAARFRAEYEAWKEQGAYNAFYDAQTFGAFNNITKQIGNITFATRLYNDLANYDKAQFEKAKASFELQRQNSLNERAGDFLDAELDAKFSKYTEDKSLSDLHSQLISYKKQTLQNWINEANSDSPLSWLYSSVLMRSGLDLSEFMSPAEAGFRYLDYGSDFIGDIVGNLNPLKSFFSGKGKTKGKK